jgi:CRISPR-associated endonuclease/helicase Cas3
MKPLSPDRFGEYFSALYARAGTSGPSPYPWQCRLAEWATRGEWPGAIDLPTGSGKTACLDIAVFALACQAHLPVVDRSAPRRVFFCVNRRVIVDEAYQRARRITRAIWQAEQDGGELILRDVASALRRLAGTDPAATTPPLDVLELRGGIYRDNRWARSLTQPTIVCTTIDQLGSRLLFRGYGVSTSAAPIQAALIAYESLILLDEAHISEPFRQTLANVQRYLDPEKWAENDIGVRPTVVVPMTATPPPGVSEAQTIRMENVDRKIPSLNRRLSASKPALLQGVKDVAKGAVKAAIQMAEGRVAAVGIIVNRVATAKEIYEQLRRKLPDTTIELAIGSMRPIDRDAQAERLRPLVGADRPPVSAKSSFVVATQCLEVGADYDFDALVTECASLDALRQRFGRLNRAGRVDAQGCPIKTQAVVLATSKAIKPDDKLDDAKPLDAIYGNALARTWNWLHAHATDLMVNFGIDAFDALLTAESGSGRIPGELLAPSASLNAPIMFPAYVDIWSQTAPRPVPEPDLSLFLHGRQNSEPDVQVCWRADIGVSAADPIAKDWCDVVALLPPTSAECMSVPISRAKRWMAKEQGVGVDDGDMLGIAEPDIHIADTSSRDRQSRPLGVLWRGAAESDLIRGPHQLRPGDTLVLPVSAGGWNEIGHIPEESAALRQAPTRSTPNPGGDLPAHLVDIAEPAFRQARRKVCMRIHPSLRKLWPPVASVTTLFDRAALPDDSPTVEQLRALLLAAVDDLPSDCSERAADLRHLAVSFSQQQYPEEIGIVLTSRRRMLDETTASLPALDDGEDLPCRIPREQPVFLVDHTNHVVDALEATLSSLPLRVDPALIRAAARLHDVGKADERFQAMLRRTDRTDAWLQLDVTHAPLAKSDGAPITRIALHQARRRAQLPVGFRHEMLSVQIAERANGIPDSLNERDLILHLIAAHHGHARPLAPVVLDDDPPEIMMDGVTLTAEDRKTRPPHRLDSGIAKRFWSLSRCWGWWGLAYLEAVLRLADQQASAAEDRGDYEEIECTTTAEVLK